MGTGDELNISERWRRWRAQVDLDEYQDRWDRLEATGRAVHGEADLVERLGGERILDAGCGMGRVAAELSRRGKSVVGVDNDPDMIARAVTAHPDLDWVLADLASVALAGRFDVVVLAGDVLGFVQPGSEAAVVANLAAHLRNGGAMVSGMAVGDRTRLAHYDRDCAAAGLVLADRFATWEGAPDDGGSYAVSVHRRADPAS